MLTDALFAPITESERAEAEKELYGERYEELRTRGHSLSGRSDTVSLIRAGIDEIRRIHSRGVPGSVDNDPNPCFLHPLHPSTLPC